VLKLSQLFFRRIALILTVTFVMAAIAGYYLLRQMEIDTHARMLRNTLTLLEQDLQALPASEFPRAIRTIHRKTGIRITVVAPDGKRAFDVRIEKRDGVWRVTVPKEAIRSFAIAYLEP